MAKLEPPSLAHPQTSTGDACAIRLTSTVSRWRLVPGDVLVQGATFPSFSDEGHADFASPGEALPGARSGFGEIAGEQRCIAERLRPRAA
jgi:hypothetical protein